MVVGGEIGGTGAGVAFTDFQIDREGFVRFLVLDRHLVPRQAGRMLQRLFEIESYRVMALLALPVARAYVPQIIAIERSLASLATQIARDEGGDEVFLYKLTGLAADVESAGCCCTACGGSSGGIERGRCGLAQGRAWHKPKGARVS